MTSRSTSSLRSSLHGKAWSFSGEALMLPIGLIVFTYLGRTLGPRDYGVYALTATIVLWIEWGLTALFDRATIKLVSEADDWRPIATTVIRLHFFLSLITAALLAALAGPISELLHEPDLAWALRLFSLEIPLSSMAQAHKYLLDGRAEFSQRSFATLSRWVMKLLFVVLLVELGFSVTGAIMGNVAASFCELVVARYWIRPALLRRSSYSARNLMISYGLPLFLQAMGLRILSKMDLIMLKALGGSAEQAGMYGAAQMLSLPVSMISVPLSAILLSTLTRMFNAGEYENARRYMVGMMRIGFWALPFVALMAWEADDVIRLVLGSAFLPAGPAFTLLVFSALFSLMLSLIFAVLTASGKATATSLLAVPLPAAAFFGHLLIIPHFTMTGAAAVTAAISFAASLASVWTVYRLWQVLPPFRTVLTSFIVTAFVSGASYVWPPSVQWPIVRLALLSFGAFGLFILIGEFSARDLVTARSLFSLTKAGTDRP